MSTPDSPRAFFDKVDSFGLWLSVTSVEILPGPPEVAKVELDVTSPRKARALLRWLDFIDVQDMVAGKFRASDQQVRLNIRGRFPSGAWVIVVAAFHEQSEAAQVALINAAIHRQQPHQLIPQLAVLEASSPRSGSG